MKSSAPSKLLSLAREAANLHSRNVCGHVVEIRKGASQSTLMVASLGGNIERLARFLTGIGCSSVGITFCAKIVTLTGASIEVIVATDLGSRRQAVVSLVGHKVIACEALDCPGVKGLRAALTEMNKEMAENPSGSQPFRLFGPK